jgi:hypothetical protein
MDLTWPVEYPVLTLLCLTQRSQVSDQNQLLSRRVSSSVCCRRGSPSLGWFQSSKRFVRWSPSSKSGRGCTSDVFGSCVWFQFFCGMAEFVQVVSWCNINKGITEDSVWTKRENYHWWKSSRKLKIVHVVTHHEVGVGPGIGTGKYGEGD